MPAWPTEIQDSPPPEVLRDLNTAARVLDELDERGVEISLDISAAGRLCIWARERDAGLAYRLSATELGDMLIAPGRHWPTLSERT